MKPSIQHTGLLLLVVLAVCQASCPQECNSCDSGRVQCAGAGLNTLPRTMPTDTLTVDLTRNNIDTLIGMPNLPEVQSMRMPLNKLRVIKGRELEMLPSLVSLDLSMNDISKVYKHGLKGLVNLRTVSLNGNKIKDVGVIFRNTQGLTSLRLNNNEIEKIEEQNFEKNTMIKMLDLSHNKITSIHGNSFKNMDMLRYLILSNNPIVRLSDLAFTSTMLSLADFSNCELESVPRTMPPSLTDYRLGSNKITSIYVDDFANITRLSLLTLNDNKVSYIEHRSFEKLENLKELWLSRNDMVYIPRGLPKNLTKIFMDGNQVVELEPMLFKEDSKLKVLSLEGNKVKKVHQDSLKYLKELEKLNLQGNQISLIDVGTFVDLPKLQSLTLTDNPVQVFETGAFSGLDSLSELSMAYIEHHNIVQDKILQENFLTSMPNLTSIDLMSSIELTQAFLELFEEPGAVPLDTVTKVNLQYNELTTLPDGVKNVLPNIKQLLLDGNLFQCDKRLLWLHDWMQSTTSVSFHQYDKPTCDGPNSVTGRLISDLAAYEFGEYVPVQTTTIAPKQPVDVNKVDRSGQSAAASDQRLQLYDNRFNPTNNNYNPASSRYPSSMAGVRVVIKPPSNPQGDTNPSYGQQMSRADLRAAKRAEREKKRREKEERKRLRKLQNQREPDARRKKRRIRNKNGKRCKVDQDGNMKCVRRKRCKVGDDGNVKCRKRKGKKKKDMAVTV